MNWPIVRRPCGIAGPCGTCGAAGDRDCALMTTPFDRVIGHESPAIVEALAEQNLETGTGRVVLLFALGPLMARAFLTESDARTLAATLSRLADVIAPTSTPPAASTRH